MVYYYFYCVFLAKHLVTGYFFSSAQPGMPALCIKVPSDITIFFNIYVIMSAPSGGDILFSHKCLSGHLCVSLFVRHKSCPLHNSYTVQDIFTQLSTNVDHDQM